MKLIFISADGYVNKTKKIQTWSYISQCTQFEWLFGAVYIIERSGHYWPIFLWKWEQPNCYGQSRHLYHQDNRYFVPALNVLDGNKVWLQQNGAICPTEHATMNLLRPTFDNSLISRSDDINWPPKSCNLTPLDYFRSGPLKKSVMPANQTQLSKWRPKITNATAEIHCLILEELHANWFNRIRYYEAIHGSHISVI